MYCNQRLLQTPFKNNDENTGLKGIVFNCAILQ